MCCSLSGGSFAVALGDDKGKQMFRIKWRFTFGKLNGTDAGFRPISGVKSVGVHQTGEQHPRIQFRGQDEFILGLFGKSCQMRRYSGERWQPGGQFLFEQHGKLFTGDISDKKGASGGIFFFKQTGECGKIFFLFGLSNAVC